MATYLQIAKEKELMLGWMLIFLVILLLGTMAAAGGTGLAFGVTASIVFGFLLLLSLLTFVFRSRA